MATNSEMSFWDHLEELRWMLFRVLICLIIFTLISFIFMPYLFDKVIMAPCSKDFILYKLINNFAPSDTLVPDFLIKPFKVDIINIKLASQFFIHMSLSFETALFITFPYLVYEIWKFIYPALYDNEKSGVKWTFLFGTVMFFLGSFVGYIIVFPLTLRFLYTYELSSSITNQLALDSYMSNFIMLIFMMGIIFELPILSMLFSKMGFLKRSFFSKYRRHAITAILIVAAVITPSSDPFTLMVVFIPVYILWELSAILVRKDDKDELLE